MGNNVVPEDRRVIVADLDGAGSTYRMPIDIGGLTVLYRPSCKSATTTIFKGVSWCIV